MSRIALVDGDYVAFKSAAACEPNKSTRSVREPEGIALYYATQLLERIGHRVAPTQYRVFLGGTGNYRYKLYPDYKANRVGKLRPTHLDAVRSLLVREWGAEVVTGYEADDAIGIAAKGDFVICAIDKDLKQIAGEHYNPTKDVFEVVSREDAVYQLYSQMLIGDSSDGIRGVDGLGPVKSKRILEGLTPEEMHLRVMGLYEDQERFLLNYKLLRILRSEDDYREVLEHLAELEHSRAITAERDHETVATGASGSGEISPEEARTETIRPVSE